jgi:peptidylprolyl isomerase
MQIVENGMFVSVAYIGTLENGEVFDTSEGRRSLEFQTGAGRLIKGFEDAVMTNENRTSLIREFYNIMPLSQTAISCGR